MACYQRVIAASLRKKESKAKEEEKEEEKEELKSTVESTTQTVRGRGTVRTVADSFLPYPTVTEHFFTLPN